MKRILTIFSLVLVAYTASAQKSFTVSGKTPSSEPVVISKIVDNKPQELASLTPANGVFTYKGSIATPEVYVVTTTLADGTNLKGLMVAEPGNITITVSDVDKAIRVEGTEANKLLQGFSTEQAALNKEQKALIDARGEKKTAGTLTDAEEEQMGQQYGALNDKKEAGALAFVKSNVNNVAGQYVLASTMNRMEPEQLKEIVASANSATQQTASIKKVNEYIASIERVAIGQPFVDLRMPNPDGKEIALSDYAGKGKYVLIDFWASWCGPCRQEMPYVVDAYKLYKDKGFEVVGVSLDRDNASWVKGIASLGMTWPQMSDIKFWGSEAVSKYVISGIPHTILLDPNGKIIEKNLRGEELLSKLAELLNK